MKSFRDRNPYIVGIVSVLLIGGITGFAFAIGLLGLLKDTYEVKAVFADAAGLRAGNEVRLAGVKVGAVDGVEVDRANGRVIVTLSINRGTDLRDEATAEIALSTLLGAKVVRLDNAEHGQDLLDGYCDDGETDEDAISDDGTDELRPAACVDGDPTIRFSNAGVRVPFDVFELTRIATEGINELNTEQVNTLVNQLGDLTEGRRDEITALVESIDDVSAAIVSRDVELTELLARADAISATLAEKDETLVALIDQSRAILTLLEERRDLLATTIGEGAEAVTALAEVISANRAVLDNLLTNLHPTVAVVGAEIDDVNRALAWIGPGIYGQALAGSHGPWLDIYVRQLGPASATLLCNLLGIPDSDCGPGG